MAFRLVALLGFIALAAGAPQLLRTQVDADFDPNPQYTFSYSVNDAVSGDSKLQSESRSGDAVQGSYSVVEPDGSRRIVEYTADDLNGFQAVVHKEAGGRAIVAPAPAPILRAAPVVAPAPIARIAPASRPAYHTIAAPLASYAAPASSAVVHSSFNAPYATYAY